VVNGKHVKIAAYDAHPDDRGLSEFGQRVIERMNRLGMVIDVSHASDQSFADVIRLSRVPVIASHSSARGVKDHPQNLSDEQLRTLRTNGGVIGITIVLPILKAVVTIPQLDRDIQAVQDRISAKGGWPSLKPEESAAFQKEFRDIKYRYPEASGPEVYEAKGWRLPEPEASPSSEET
jgi:membrane dipeptidase